MTDRQSHSYLDFCVFPEVRGLVMSREPAVLFDEGLSAVRWANAAGAELFGGQGIADLLQVELSDSQSFIRQLRAAVSQIDGDSPLYRGFRIYRGDQTALLNCEIRRIENDGERVVLLVSEKDDDEAISERDLARAAVEALTGFAEVAAIVDDHGLPIGASGNFAENGVATELLADLVAELRDETDRLIKRPIQTLADETWVAGLARIQDEPGRSLLVLAAPSPADAFETEGEEDALSEEPAPAPEMTEAKLSDVLEELAAAKPAIEAATDIVEDETSLDDDLPEILDEPELAEFAGPGELAETDEAEFTDEAFERAGVTPFQFDPASEPVRFAWTTDDNGIFRSVSPELAETVGPNAADIVDRSWHNVATVFGFDTNGEIGRLLARRDTWSGKSVMWPIQGTDLVVPIDLAALPVFGSGRSFEGFRGFGIIRTADTMLDPEETGLVLAQRNQQTTTEPSGEPEIRMRSAPEETEEIVDLPADNLVDLFQSKDTDGPRRLSDPETRAFEEIRERLGDFDDFPLGREDKTDGDGASAEVTSGTAEADKEAEELGRERSYAKAEAGMQTNTFLLDMLPVNVLVYRTDEILYANHSLLEFSGYENVSDLTKAGGLEHLLEVIEAEDDGKNQYLLTRKDGSQQEIEPVLNTVPWEDEKALLLSFSSRPSEAVQVPSPIAITEISEIQNILDTASDGILVMEANGDIVSINASAEALFGVSYDDVSGTGFTELFALESRETVAEYISSRASDGVGSLFNDGREVIGRESKGGLIPLFLTISKLDTSGRLCAVVRDMTSWKNAEEELVNARRTAEVANEQKSDFLTQISHEIRTPLNAIIGFSDVMIEEQFGPIDNERYREYLRDIKRSGIHVLDLVNDLLDLSKIEAGKLELSFEAVDLNQVVAESVALMQPQANGNRIIIRTSLSRAVPKVVADTRSIRQIILNLVSNAIKFTPSNGQVIVSTVYESDGEVALRIRDTGTGMSEPEIEEAMKPFQQVHKVSEKTSKGTGLGLPLTKALVEANRAKFELESEPDQGTIAHVRFPTQRVLTS